MVLNVYEAIDILTLIKNGTYDELGLTVGEALLKRPDVSPSSYHHTGLVLIHYIRTSPEYTHALGMTD